MPDPATEQVKKNYDAFVAQLPDLIKTHPGRFALMREGAIIEFFDTPRDAYAAGSKMYTDEKRFSIQQVVEAPVDLGFFSHAVS